MEAIVSQPSKSETIAQVAAGVLQLVVPGSSFSLLVPLGLAAFKGLKAALDKPTGGGNAVEVRLIENLIIDKADRVISSGEALLDELNTTP